jgi:hypothetical protein
MEWKSTVATLTLYLHNISLSGAITLSVFYLSTMARGLSWTSTEVEACAKAFVSATNNPVRGSDQRQQDFIDDILKALKRYAPTNLVEADGTYHHRGNVVWSHLRDSVFSDVQKFNESLRLVYLSKPTGITEQQKINIAVAIHNNKISSVDYSFQDSVPCAMWKHYLAWLVLKD